MEPGYGTLRRAPGRRRRYGWEDRDREGPRRRGLVGIREEGIGGDPRGFGRLGGSRGGGFGGGGVRGPFAHRRGGVEPPPRPELAGPLAENDELAGSELVAAGRIRGPEDIAFDERGRLYTGSEDGRIYRVEFGEGGGEKIEEFADTGGRSLGLRFDAEGNLVVTDSATRRR